MSTIKHQIKALLISGSRADHNALSMVGNALIRAGHLARIATWPHFALLPPNDPDVIIVAGDRLEILKAAIWCTESNLPICHLSGGDMTLGSADDRYRDAITALSCIHCTETQEAWVRLAPRIKCDDYLTCTGNPALDMIVQSSIYSITETYERVGISMGEPNILVCVHPNTVGKDRFLDFNAVHDALVKMPEDATIILIGANADPGGNAINERWRGLAGESPSRYIYKQNLEPRLYHSLMTHCDVMVGNSSAMLTEAPMFGLYCVLVGDRQTGRPVAPNIIHARAITSEVCIGISEVIARGRAPMRVNPYGDGHSAPKVVEALEANTYRWAS